MKKTILFILLSTFVFGQNVQLLKKVHGINEIEAQQFNKEMLPDYKLIDYYQKGVSVNYIYVPNNADENEVKDCKLGNPCERKIMLNFKNVNSLYSFENATGQVEPLKQFWLKNVQPTTTQKNNYIYKNKEEKIWLTFHDVGKKWMIKNMSYRSQP